MLLTGVKIGFNRSESDRRLVDKNVDLVFDDTDRACDGEGSEKQAALAYDDVSEVVFDAATHMRAARWASWSEALRSVDRIYNPNTP